jgi:UDPglucose--hexose-1-phosphate uridylyltransferase
MAAHATATGRCLVCDMVEREIAAASRVVLATERFAVLAAVAPRVPYELLIVPRTHRPSFALADDAELAALAAVIGDALGRLARRLDDPPFNLALHDAPVDPEPPPFGYHWHLEVVPRIGTTGGFEWGADSFINTTPPEEAAAELGSA